MVNDLTRLLCLNTGGLKAPAHHARLASTYLYPPQGTHPDIICLQETHSTPMLTQVFLNTFQLNCQFAHAIDGRGGLLTGFRRDLDSCVHAHFPLTHLTNTPRPTLCQALLTHCTIKQMEMVIVNVYIPPYTHTKDREEFLVKLEREWQQFGCTNIICCGDFNMCLDPAKDAGTQPHMYRILNNSSIFQSFVDSAELVDTFRIHNPISRRFTCFSAAYNSGKRLDYIFSSGSFLSLIQNSEILPRRTSDHNPVLLSLTINRNPKGPGYWRFPNAILTNPQYVDWMKIQINEAVQLNKEGASPDLLWDTVKCRIHDLTTQFLKKDRDADKTTYESFQNTLASLYSQRDSTTDPTLRSTLNDEIVQVTQEWTDFTDKIDAKRLEFNIGRKRQLHEKSSKFFFRKFNAIPGSSHKLYNKNGELCTTDKDILQICHEFYSSLYNKEERRGDSPYAFLPGREENPLIPPAKVGPLQAEITLEELFQALKGMRKGKAPGLDGITVDFYKVFWEEVGPLVFASIKHAQKTGQLSISQKRAVIKLLPKRDKNPQFVQNLRPITLLNVDVKFSPGLSH